MPSPRQVIQRHQAAARRAVMAGAEGERRLDLDAEIVRMHARAVVRAVHEEAAGAHRLQAFEALAYPVGVADGLEAQRLRGLVAAGDADELAQPHLVSRALHVHGDLPLAAVVLEGGASGLFGVEAFGQEGRDATGGLLVGAQASRGGIGHGGRRWPLAARRAMAPDGVSTGFRTDQRPKKKGKGGGG